MRSRRILAGVINNIVTGNRHLMDVAYQTHLRSEKPLVIEKLIK